MQRRDLAKAQAAGQARSRRADQILSRPATQPGNDCGSARDRIDDWLSSRGTQ
jgi:hypothetical protein